MLPDLYQIRQHLSRGSYRAEALASWAGVIDGAGVAEDSELLKIPRAESPWVFYPFFML